MTIPRNSKSYPYLAIAQHYNVDYSRVLQYSEKLVRVGIGELCVGELALFTNWRYEVWRLEKNKLKIGVDI